MSSPFAVEGSTPRTARSPADLPHLRYEDVLLLIELIKSASAFSELRLRVGGIEIELVKGDAAPAVPVGAPAPAARASIKDVAAADGVAVVRAPMVGTVYHAPEPGAAPFIQVGQTVAPGQQVCIIEVMKLMNTVVAETHGVLQQVLVANGEAVEPGQALFVIASG